MRILIAQNRLSGFEWDMSVFPSGEDDVHLTLQRHSSPLWCGLYLLIKGARQLGTLEIQKLRSDVLSPLILLGDLVQLGLGGGRHLHNKPTPFICTMTKMRDLHTSGAPHPTSKGPGMTLATHQMPATE